MWIPETRYESDRGFQIADDTGYRILGRIETDRQWEDLREVRECKLWCVKLEIIFITHKFAI
jgi:hypothetical protein